jgi:(1->4)-alpha-D-glucan 1-alpha-D-glucosylmutase
MTVQLEDALGLTEQANLPGTTDAHPNWRRKLPESLAQMRVNERVGALARKIAALRPGAEPPG